MTIRVGILNDTTLCTGCERCVEACKKENRLGADLPRRWKQSIDDLSSTRFTTIVRRDGNHFVRRLCRHCEQPACVSACIVGALQKTAEGPVIYDSSKCIGCRYCIMSCPYGIPRYDWESPIPHVRKCTMCYPRIRAGRMPACVEACPEKATIFGSRDEMIREAHRRIEKNPERYLQAVVGETEVGGTSVLYISDIPLGFLGYNPRAGKPAASRFDVVGALQGAAACCGHGRADDRDLLDHRKKDETVCGGGSPTGIRGRRRTTSQ